MNQDRLSALAAQLRRCTLGKPSPLECGGVCDGCGWSEAEIERRKKLPLFRDKRGLWHKRVGVRESKPA